MSGSRIIIVFKYKQVSYKHKLSFTKEINHKVPSIFEFLFVNKYPMSFLKSWNVYTVIKNNWVAIVLILF